MAEELAAAADIVTGAAMAHAVEPSAGALRPDTGGMCLNCGAVLIGSHCHVCGQKSAVHRTLTAFWHDLAHGVLHFEGKVWHTLPLLFWRPGELTRRYVHGERAKFVSPLALFLFSVFLMFAVFESVGGPAGPSGLNADKPGIFNVDTRSDFAKELATAKARVKKLTAERQIVVAGDLSTKQIDAELKELKSDISGLEMASQLVEGKPIDQLPDGIRINAGSQDLNDRVKAALRNPKLLLYKLQTSAYKFAWALIPMSVPFMWLLFAWRRQYKLYDHSIFVTYSLCFTMLLLIIMALIAAAGIQTGWAILLIPVHLFRQLKHAYRITNFGAFWRTCILLNVAVFVLTAFGILLLGLGLTA